MAAKPFDPTRPYNALPMLPPKTDLESKAILKACIGAHSALAELKGADGLMPNSAILMNTLLVLEARASSAIENIVTTADQLFRFAGGEAPDAHADPATKEALRYRTALRMGFESLARKPLSTDTAVAVCRTIRGADVDVRKVPGTALTNQATGKVVYTPPAGESRLRDMLGDWERYLHDASGIEPLVILAVTHYQFEAIHPFTDGNGRTGRVLNLLFLVERGLLDLPILYLSRGIIATKADYYRLLLRVTTHGEWEAWTKYMVGLVEKTARWTTAKVRAIRTLMDVTTQRVKTHAPKLYSRELVELVFTQPYCRISNVVRAGIAQRQAAAEYLNELVEIGVLQERKVGREKLFVNPRLMDLLTAENYDVPTVEPTVKPRTLAERPAPVKRRNTPRNLKGAGVDTPPVLHDDAPAARVSPWVDAQLRFAIAHKQLVELTYHGRRRVAEPHDYGIQKGTPKLLVYQRHASADGDTSGRSPQGWRLLDAAQILECSVLEGKFPGSRGDAHHRHYTWDVLYVRVG